MPLVNALLVLEDGTVEDFNIEREDVKRRQDLVGGYIEKVDFDEGVHVWCNEEAKPVGLKPNGVATDLCRGFLFSDDYIAGPAIVQGNVGDHDAHIPAVVKAKVLELSKQHTMWAADTADEVEWLNFGDYWLTDHGLNRQDILDVRERMIWRRTDQAMAMMPAVLARSMVLEMRIPGVKRIGYGVGAKSGLGSSFGVGTLVGIEGEHDNRRYRLYAVDGGNIATPMLSEKWNWPVR